MKLFLNLIPMVARPVICGSNVISNVLGVRTFILCCLNELSVRCLTSFLQMILGGNVRLITTGAAPLSSKVMTFLRCAMGACYVSEHQLTSVCKYLAFMFGRSLFRLLLGALGYLFFMLCLCHCVGDAVA